MPSSVRWAGLDLRASDIARAFKVEHDKMYSTSAVA